MRFLCVSDIHGHADRLNAVLETASGLGWDQLVACGDHCFPGPRPLEVWKKLVEHKAICARGMTERALAQINPNRLTATTQHERDRIERLRQVHHELGELIIARLGKLDTMVHVPVESGLSMLVVHGSPVDAAEPFGHELSDEELLALLGNTAGDIVVCGGSHVPFERIVDDVHFINVGSVGEPAGGTHASAAIVETSQVGMRVQWLEVPI